MMDIQIQIYQIILLFLLLLWLWKKSVANQERPKNPEKTIIKPNQQPIKINEAELETTEGSRTQPQAQIKQQIETENRNNNIYTSLNLQYNI